MAHYGMLRNYRFPEAAEDVRGAKLFGFGDEKLGKIEDVIFDYVSGTISYVVVDTGGWLTTKKFLVPAGRLRASTKHEDDFTCDLTKQQIENFPPYDESDLESDEQWAAYEGRYRSKWETGPVMHRAETDRNITPTTQQMKDSGLLNQPQTVSRADAKAKAVEAASTPTERIVPAGVDSVVIENTAVGIGGRWDTFQARLRERRKEAVMGSKTVAGSESAGSLKKAV
jgi:PRC-barrel domain